MKQKEILKNLKGYSQKALMLATLSLLVMAPQAKAVDFADYVKGCVVVGSAGVGSVALASGMSGSKQATTMSALAVGGALTCAIGAFLSSDISKKASVDASGQYLRDYNDLKSKIIKVERDLCLVKRECGPDGKPIERTQSTSPVGGTLPLNSGNIIQ